MAIGFGSDKSHLEGASGAFSYMAWANVQEQPVKKPLQEEGSATKFDRMHGASFIGNQLANC